LINRHIADLNTYEEEFNRFGTELGELRRVVEDLLSSNIHRTDDPETTLSPDQPSSIHITHSRSFIYKVALYVVFSFVLAVLLYTVHHYLVYYKATKA
jgi:hypothetical protein